MSDSLPFCDGSMWIWSGAGTWSAPTPSGRNPFRMAYFRRAFEAPEGAKLTLHVTADSRYRLWCNGRIVGRGPAKGDVRHHFYETYELGDFLVSGKNVLAVHVLSYSSAFCFPPESSSPTSIMFAMHALAVDGTLVDSQGRAVEKLDSGDAWKAKEDETYIYAARENWNTFLGMWEDFDGADYPWGWQSVDFDDSDWQPAHAITRAAPRDVWLGSEIPHILYPRVIPALEETPKRFDGAARARNTDAAVWQALIADDAPVTIPAGTEAEITLYSAVETTGFPTLRTAGGAGAEIRQTYSEGVWFDGKLSPRHDPENGDVVGFYDRFFPGGGEEEYEPFHWRTFRYLKLSITTGAEPLTVTGMTYRFTAYPFEARASFRSSDDSHERLWDMSWRTARLCAHETYEDCPYHEQLQYIGDTQVQALLSYYMTGDARLAKQAIRHFDWSRDCDGLMRSRYPSQCVQDIPTYSLLWMVMVRDYWWHTGDVDEAAERFEGMMTTLRWFERHENAQGLLHDMPHWNFVDWVAEWQDRRGAPPNASSGISAVINFEYAYALRCAAEVAEAVDRDDMARKYLLKVKRIGDVLNQLVWTPEEGLYRDRPDGNELSELCNAWAILAGAADRSKTDLILKRLGSDSNLAAATLYGRFYVLRAVREAGGYEDAEKFLDHWYTMMKTDLTTFPEDPYLGRSYCHAWSAAPLHELLAEILGVKPAAPGFGKIVIQPHLWGLSWAEGSVPTPHGMVNVRWDLNDGEFALQVEGPKHVPMEIILPDGSRRVATGKADTLKCAIVGR